MDNRTWTYGNLALAEPIERDHEPASKMNLKVIDGGAVNQMPSVAVDARPRTRMACWFAAALIICGLLLAVFLRFSVDSSRRAQIVDSISYERVTVRPGDSLWSLAREHSVEGISTEDLVSIMKARNGVSDSLLQPGQSLLVAASSHLE